VQDSRFFLSLVSLSLEEDQLLLFIMFIMPWAMSPVPLKKFMSKIYSDGDGILGDGN